MTVPNNMILLVKLLSSFIRINGSGILTCLSGLLLFYSPLRLVAD